MNHTENLNFGERLMTRFVFLTALAALIVAAPVAGQQNLDPVRTYALDNVRVVVSPGNVIETGTVYVRDGRIVEVAEQVDVPAGVQRIDLAGHTVYPGLIDAATSMGLPAPQFGGGRFGGGGEASDGPTVEAASPSRAASAYYEPTSEELDEMRAAGITAVAIGFADGIFTGQVAAFSTKTGTPAEQVLRSPVAVQAAFGRNFGGYPSTLMGAIAFIRQSLYDAQWEVQALAAFERDQAAAPRPTYDPEATALIPVVEGDLPMWMIASEERMMGRMMGIAEEFAFDDYVLMGAQEGYRIADALGAAGNPVIVSLDFPNPNNVTGRIFELEVTPVSGDESAGEEADSTVARQLRANAAELVAAGVPVALSSWGLDGPEEFRTHILAAVEAGLSADDALRALTVTPAEILGLDGSMGTIESGKLANLVVTDGDLFSEDGQIREVYLEGERHLIEQDESDESAGPGRGGRGGGPGAPDGAALRTQGGIR